MANFDLTCRHVELRVTDLDAARRFYVDQLGLEVLQHAPAIQLLALRAGPVRLSIFGGLAKPAAAGACHLVFGVADLDAAIAALRAAGIEAADAQEAPGFLRFSAIRDPNGTLIELAEYLRDPLAPV
jgi:catechol 2,3-dioxygenase-like lactoylglutathione lyase family enzyme